MTSPTPEAHRRGLLLTIAGALVLVPDTLLIRLSDMEPFALMVWRGLIAVAVLLSWLVISGEVGKGALPTMARRIGWPGVAFAACFSLGSLCFVSALMMTTVTSVLVVVACVPIVAAIVSRLTLGERLAPETAVAMAGCLAGLGLVGLEDLGSGRFLGMIVASGVAFGMGTGLTILRAHPQVPVAAASALGMFFTAMAGLVMSGGFHAPAAAGQWIWIVLNSAVVVPLSFSLLFAGPRTLPAAEVGLILLLETVLGPILVWAVLGEYPGDLALVGAVVVIASLAGRAGWRLVRRPAA